MSSQLHAVIIIFFFIIAAAAADQSPFKLEKSETVVRTEGGEIRVFAGRSLLLRRSTPVHIGFITMEPETLLIPQYIDANLIFFLRRGEGKIGWILKDNFVESGLKPGDVVRIPAGSAFYVVNTGGGQQLEIICSIDSVETTGFDETVAPYRPFFIGGGEYPRSVLAGFDINTLTSAFNATPEEVSSLKSARVKGPIIFLPGDIADKPRRFSAAVRTETEELKQRKLLRREHAEEEGQEGQRIWTWAGILRSIFIRRSSNFKAEADEDKVYNIYDHEPDYRNKFGWTVEVNEHVYPPLKESDISVFFVNLTAGSMVAPHVNPRATEYGIVIAGAGTVEVVYPNGTRAAKAEVKVGDVFCVPRFFAFCQMAGREGPMEIVGFTTSARRNRSEFLAGAGSVLGKMMGAELAAGFGLPEEGLRRLVAAQNESVILPSSPEKEREVMWREQGRREFI